VLESSGWDRSLKREKIEAAGGFKKKPQTGLFFYIKK
jgi:hypothetical protein